MNESNEAALRARNRAVWWVGADDGSTGYEVVLEQTDGSFHGLFRVEPGGDAMAIGMMVGYLDTGGYAGARWVFAESLPKQAEASGTDSLCPSPACRHWMSNHNERGCHDCPCEQAGTSGTTDA